MPNTLEDILWIYPYKMGSKSALALAEACDVWCIKHEGSKFKGSASKVILNWGAGTGVFNVKPLGAKVLNTPEQVDTAINKLDFFRKMRGPSAPRVPFWTQNRDQALGWAASGLQIVCRTVLEGMKGVGLVVATEASIAFPEAPLYTVLVPSTAEYRVYMFNGKVLDSRIKLLAENEEENPDGMRHEDKYEYCKLKAPLPEDVTKQAEKCILKIGLFTGGVDVLWDAKSGLATILEVNTACYLGQDTAKLYAKAFKEYLAA